MKGLRKTLETTDLSDSLSHTIQISNDEETVYLKVKYLDRFLIEKMFRNNYFGLEDLKKVQKTLDTEEKVVQYLGLGDKNGK